MATATAELSAFQFTDNDTLYIASDRPRVVTRIPKVKPRFRNLESNQLTSALQTRLDQFLDSARMMFGSFQFSFVIKLFFLDQSRSGVFTRECIEHAPCPQRETRISTRPKGRSSIK